MKIKNAVCYSFFLNDEGSLAHLRLIGPLGQSGINIINGIENDQIIIDRVLEGDIVIIQRNFPREFNDYEKIMEIAHKEKKPVVFDLDDLLFCLPENHLERQSTVYATSLLPMYQLLLEADFVSVATPKLRDTIINYNDNVVVLPNYFDDNLWRLKPPVLKRLEHEVLTIGYMGGNSHIPDIDYITPVILDLIIRYPRKIRFHFFGMQPPIKVASLTQAQWSPAPTYRYKDFATIFQTQTADIFIAPLIDNLFNKCKSPIKFFEYSALGVPGVFSRLEPYTDVITHGHNGLLASSLDEWTNCLIQLIEDEELRFSIAKNAQETIRSNWLLSQNAFRWKETFQSAFDIPSKYKKQDNNGKINIVKSINPQIFVTFNKKEAAIQSLRLQVADRTRQLERTSQDLNEILISKTWKFAVLLRKIRVKLLPPGSWLERPIRLIFRILRSWRNEGWHLFKVKSRRISFAKLFKMNLGDTSTKGTKSFEIPEVELPVPPKLCRCSIDIIVCVHNALDDVKLCLSSVIQNTDQPYNLIIINDGSSEETTAFLDIFANQYNNIKLVNNEIANGYTRAANQGLHISTSDLVILLNSDTVVSKDWANRMAVAMFSREKTGLVGPLSNTASWQSIPDISVDGDWSPNPLPEGMSIQKMADSIAKYSGQIYPNVPLLNGFCWMFNREVINDIGYLDEENFGEGYGEEDDYILRARKAGWKIAWADDVYVYHAQSRSFSHERRKKLSQRALKTLFMKYDQAMIAQDCNVMLQDRVLNGIRVRSKVLFEREEFIRNGLEQFRGKRVLFILPISGPGGGGNVVIADGMAMLEMGVDVGLFNLISNRESFLRSYPNLKIPVIFGNRGDIVSLASQYDAVIATIHTTVEWLEPIQQKDGYPVRGYYIQGFEALMYEENTYGYNNAIDSYSLFPDLVRFTKTQWVYDQVLENTGKICHIIGISNNIDLFRPRYPLLPSNNKDLTRIGGMVRAGSHYRSPVLTMNVFRRIAREYGQRVQVIIFGVDPHNLDSMNVPKDFNFWSAGVINQKQMANLLNNLDIFVDFSSHQAMGLTALEAMACGCAVIVPANGGAVEFVENGENGLVVDTSSEEDCYQELKRLIDQDDLRKKIQQRAIVDVCRFHSEGTAYRILNALFQK